LINRSPQILRLTIDLHEDFIDVQGIAVALVLALQSPGVPATKLDTPETDGFITYDNTSFSQQILDISMTQVEPII
jgi:hypothetical protein